MWHIVFYFLNITVSSSWNISCIKQYNSFSSNPENLVDTEMKDAVLLKVYVCLDELLKFLAKGPNSLYLVCLSSQQTIISLE